MDGMRLHRNDLFHSFISPVIYCVKLDLKEEQRSNVSEIK
jgi:hypothetical protein